MSPRMKLLLMMGLFALPTLASFAAFYWFPPTKTSNYGELISPVINLPALPLSVLDGADAKRGEGEQGLRGKWLIVTRDSGGCEAGTPCPPRDTNHRVNGCNQRPAARAFRMK